jgi:hypothetical protein
MGVDAGLPAEAQGAKEGPEAGLWKLDAGTFSFQRPASRIHRPDPPPRPTPASLVGRAGPRFGGSLPADGSRPEVAPTGGRDTVGAVSRPRFRSYRRACREACDGSPLSDERPVRAATSGRPSNGMTGVADRTDVTRGGPPSPPGHPWRGPRGGGEHRTTNGRSGLRPRPGVGCGERNLPFVI